MDKTQELKTMVEEYKTTKGSDSITIPIHDFLVMYKALQEICSEYGGAQEIEEIYRPIDDKYCELYESLHKPIDKYYEELYKV